MKPITLLLDLDNTLLDTKMETFLPAYFEALAGYFSSRVAPEAMFAALRSGVGKMLKNGNPSRTLQEVFEEEFYPRIGLTLEEMRPAIKRFYDEVFPTLGVNTRPRPGVIDLMQWAVAAGHQLAVATDPLFPKQATEERVRWAGLDPRDFELVTSFESFHFSKSNIAYYAELLGRLGWPDCPVVMAGDDLERDIAAAAALGLTTFHVKAAETGEVDAAAPHQELPVAQPAGDLFELQAWLRASELEAFSPSPRNRRAVLAMLTATPAVLQSLVAGLDAESWLLEPSPDDWAMIELICHLRDTEREVHAIQLRTLLDSPAPFVPRPDAAVWAKQRRYLRENGPLALIEFATARQELLYRLEALPDDVWRKPARHAIFGPTDFQEVIGFMADHDRLHLQQARSTLDALKTPAHRL